MRSRYLNRKLFKLIRCDALPSVYLQSKRGIDLTDSLSRFGEGWIGVRSCHSQFGRQVTRYEGVVRL
ncbi:MAG: hypothetical protein K0Q96_2227 [Rubrobacteraceae bacterium]|jgi:hypothetical protein|nr:hypothetical protein [Rubrobacteraceae bacterium]